MTVGEWDQRQLCPDGACVGVIGPDGTCKVCGHAAPNWGDERTRGLLAPEADEAEAADEADDLDDEYDDDSDLDDEDDEDDEDDDYEDDDAAEADAEPGKITAVAGDWGDRMLCPDGACIGVIGADGRCGTCGKLAEGAVPKLAIEVEITDNAVQTTDDAVQTAGENVHTDAAPPDPDAVPDGAEPLDPDGKAKS